MKKSIKRYILVIPLIILVINIIAVDSKPIPEKTLFRIIQQGLEAWHYSGRKIDNYFSATGLKEYLSYLDYNKRYFLQSDIDEFKKFEESIDDELVDGNPELMNFASKKINMRINSVLKLVEEYLSRPFDYTKDESVEFSPDKRDYFKSENEQRKYWRKVLKYNVLNKYIQLAKTKKLSPVPVNKELEKKSRKEIKKNFVRRLERNIKTNQKDAISLFINSIVQVFDPHTTYFPPKQMEDFDIEMTGKLEGIGALLGEKDGYVSIVRIIPGGPSWKQKQLKAGDKILKVAQGNGEPLDIVGMRTIDAVKHIRGKKGTLVKLTVQKPDGTTSVIPIIRDVVIIEETFAKSTVIKDKNSGKNYGYIYLPGFYNDFRDEKGRKSSEDVKREIERMKSSDVEGLILDLRGNSGGALNDAINLSGLFIKKGPILQTKNRHTGIRILNDPDPAIHYKKPLIVLLNSLSASASEIVAAALQDYKRAIIVGGSQSFGKGTVQMLIDLNRFVKKKSEGYNNLGAFKVTIQKFYRITGSSNQYKGVIPDIVLPDHYDHLKIGERYYNHPLRSDNIKPLNHSDWNYGDIDIKKIRELSRERTSNSEGFSTIKEYIGKLKELRANRTYGLKIDKLLEEKKQIEKDSKKLDKVKNYLKDFLLVSNLTGRSFKSDKLKKIAEDNEKNWFEQLAKDIQLNESLMILKDMIKLKKEKG
ncbi:MAG: carboxy terminal-processing peptidase [Acidobacteriota bacterium]